MNPPASPALEICIDCVASARAAAQGGADRVELCANLPEGGTTPSAGMIQAVRSAFDRKLMVIIRPRGYDFLYSEDEVAVMLADIRTARQFGADGLVIGCLTSDGRVDLAACQRLLSESGALDITFHRAFDMSRDVNEALEDIAGLGIKRILTSGGQQDAPSGLPTIKSLVRKSAGRLSIMPGGGVTEANLDRVVGSTGAREIHLSARASIQSRMLHRNKSCAMGAYSSQNEFEWREASVEKIRLAKATLINALVSSSAQATT